jgi:hypothetical protein
LGFSNGRWATLRLGGLALKLCCATMWPSCAKPRPWKKPADDAVPKKSFRRRVMEKFG